MDVLTKSVFLCHSRIFLWCRQTKVVFILRTVHTVCVSCTYPELANSASFPASISGYGRPWHFPRKSSLSMDQNMMPPSPLSLTYRDCGPCRSYSMNDIYRKGKIISWRGGLLLINPAQNRFLWGNYNSAFLSATRCFEMFSLLRFSPLHFA